MSLMKEIFRVLFTSPHRTTVEVTLPTQLYLALESYVYLRNETLNHDEYEPLDRDYVISHVLSKFLAKQMIRMPEHPRPKEPVELELNDEYTQGRRQNRRPAPQYHVYPPNY
jgi:hypothetical protein